MKTPTRDREQPFMIVKCKTDEEWKALRQRYIGSSDAAPIMGCGFAETSATSVWLDKIGEGVEYSNDEMEEGKILEASVIELFKHYHPEYAVETCGRTLFIRKELGISCTPDAIITDEYGRKGILECKVAGLQALDEWADGGLPEKYNWQVQHQLYCTDYEYAFVACLLCSRYQKRTVEFDGWYRSSMEEVYPKFQRHVRDRTPPDWDNSPQCHKELRRRVVDLKGIVVDREITAKIDSVLESRAAIEATESEWQSMANEVVRAIGDAQYVLTSDGRCVKIGVSAWKELKRMPKGIEIA